MKPQISPLMAVASLATAALLWGCGNMQPGSPGEAQAADVITMGHYSFEEPREVTTTAVAPVRFIEVPGIADLRAWSDGTTIVYVRGAKIVSAVVVGTSNTPALIPAAGTQLYYSDGSYSGWVIPEVAETPELQFSPMADSPYGLFTKRPDYSAAGVAENGSYYGEISTVNGLPRTHLISGYYRSDGTYVRGYYRSN